MKIGNDVRISDKAVFVNPDLVEIGNHVAIDAFVIVTPRFTVGNYVHIAPHCSIIGGPKTQMIFEDFSFAAAGTRIVCASDDFHGEGLISPVVPAEFRVVKYTTVHFKRFSGTGTNVVVHPGVTFGEGAVVGSNSLVTKDLEDWGIYVGSPARRVGTRKKETILQYAAELEGRDLKLMAAEHREYWNKYYQQEREEWLERKINS